MRNIISEKGQVTIPKKLRESLGLGAGTELEFSEEGGRLVARRVVREDPLQELVGLLPIMDVDVALERLRGAGRRPRTERVRHDHRRR
jgi:antitoxin PrlF